MFSLGLPGFCTFLYMVRIFQSMQDTRTAFRLYLFENGLNIVFGVALVGPLGVRGLALSLSIAYSVAALLAMAVVRRRVGGLGGDEFTTPVKRVLGASAVMAVATVLALNVSGAPSGFGLFARWSWLSWWGWPPTWPPPVASGARRPAAQRSEGCGPAWSDGPTPADDPGAVAADRRPEAPPVDPFHGRLDDQPGNGPYRHLRPVTVPLRTTGPRGECRGRGRGGSRWPGYGW